MKKLLSFLLMLAIVPSTSFTQRHKGKFEIVGSLTGFADSTLIYLDNLDSTFIINNQFHFTGSMKEDVKKVVLRTANFSDYKFFWLPNAVVTFRAEKGKFKEATITGSKTQDEQNRLDALIKTTGDEKQQSISFICRHPNSIISANILSVYASTWGKDLATKLYRNLSTTMKTTPYGREILEFITLNRAIKVGDPYIDFTQKNVEGKDISLSDYKGRVTLLEFWGSWCMPCREGNQELVKIYNEFRGAGFEILGTATESEKDAWVEAVKKDGLPWQNISELKGDKSKAALMYGISYYPANFLIDRNGIIVAKDVSGDALRNKLHELLE